MSSSGEAIKGQKGEIDTIQYLATLLKFAMGKDASDIHLRTRTHPVVRIDGQLQAVERFPATSPSFMKDLTDKIIPEHNKEAFESLRQADFFIWSERHRACACQCLLSAWQHIYGATCHQYSCART